MGRKKKLINQTDVPQFAIERFARCVFDDIRAFHDREEGQREFALWQAEQAELNRTRAAKTAALVLFTLHSRTTGFSVRENWCTIGEIGLFVSGEINK